MAESKSIPRAALERLAANLDALDLTEEEGAQEVAVFEAAPSGARAVCRKWMSATSWRQKCVLLPAAAVALVVLAAGPAWAQIDPGNFDIRQNDVVVGHIFVPRHLSSSVYVEHWVVSGDYVYPSPGTAVRTEIVSSSNGYVSEKEFFRRVDFGPGSRYIRITAQDGDKLPRSGNSGLSAPQSLAYATVVPLERAQTAIPAALILAGFLMARIVRGRYAGSKR